MALCAAMVLSLCPGGRALHRTGPCGQSLCVCPESTPERHESCCIWSHDLLSLTHHNFTSSSGLAKGWNLGEELATTSVPKLEIVADARTIELPGSTYTEEYPVRAVEIPYPPPRA